MEGGDLEDLLGGGEPGMGGLDGGEDTFYDPSLDPFAGGPGGSDMPGDFDPGMGGSSDPAAGGMDDGGYGGGDGGYGGGDDGSYDPLPDPSGMDGM